MSLATIAETMRKDLRQKGHPSIKQRKERLQAMKKAIIEKESSIFQALKADLGKSSFEAYGTEVGFILEEISFALKNMDDWAKVKKVGTPLALFPGKSYIHPEPFGVVLIISPWNYPFQLCVSPVVGAIAAGNRIVIKPSEFASKTATIISELMSSVFPAEEVQVVEGGLEETQILLKQKFDYIFFTGSTPVGKIIMKAAAEHLTPVTLELGGKSPCIIEETANIDVAAKRVAWGKFLNAGQTCVAPDYILIPEKMQDEFVSKLKSHVDSFYGSDARSSADYPRIINQRHFDRLKALMIPGKIAFGGESSAPENYIAPTVMKNVSWTDKIMEDEIFGPILPVIPYTNLQDAIREVQERPKPLAFYVFSESPMKQDMIVEQIPFGGGCVNDTLVHLANPNLPFGGVGASGLGSYHGKKSFDTFTHYKSVYQQGTMVDIPIRYPPYEGKLNLLKLFMR